MLDCVMASRLSLHSWHQVGGLNYCCDMHWFRAVNELLLTDVFDDVVLPVSAAEVAAHRASSSLAGT